MLRKNNRYSSYCLLKHVFPPHPQLHTGEYVLQDTMIPPVVQYIHTYLVYIVYWYLVAYIPGNNMRYVLLQYVSGMMQDKVLFAGKLSRQGKSIGRTFTLFFLCTYHFTNSSTPGTACLLYTSPSPRD